MRRNTYSVFVKVKPQDNDYWYAKLYMTNKFWGVWANNEPLLRGPKHLALQVQAGVNFKCLNYSRHSGTNAALKVDIKLNFTPSVMSQLYLQILPQTTQWYSSSGRQTTLCNYSVLAGLLHYTGRGKKESSVYMDRRVRITGQVISRTLYWNSCICGKYNVLFRMLLFQAEILRVRWLRTDIWQ